MQVNGGKVTEGVTFSTSFILMSARKKWWIFFPSYLFGPALISSVNSDNITVRFTVEEAEGEARKATTCKILSSQLTWIFLSMSLSVHCPLQAAQACVCDRICMCICTSQENIFFSRYFLRLPVWMFFHASVSKAHHQIIRLPSTGHFVSLLFVWFLANTSWPG